MRPSFQSLLTQGPAPLSCIVIAASPDSDARVILAAALTSAGYRLRLADSGDDLLREAMASDVSLAIVDVNLKRSDGESAIEALKHARNPSDVPILAFDSVPAALTAPRSRALGADRFLRNPSDLRDLFSVVATMQAAGRRRRDAGSAR